MEPIETFEQACREAARLWPERFQIVERNDIGKRQATGEDVALKTLFFSTREKSAAMFCYTDGKFQSETTTQDDIDEMARLLGWEYSIGCGEDYGKIITDEWYPLIWPKNSKVAINLWDFFPTKLEAAKFAFIAIVEQERKKK